MTGLDLKTLVGIASLGAVIVAGVINLKTDVAGAKTDISALKDDISEIRSAQITTSTRIEKLYDVLIGNKVAEVE